MGDANDDIQRNRGGVHPEGARRPRLAPRDVPGADDVRTPEKRCFTYCGDDYCTCEARPSPFIRALNRMSAEEIRALKFAKKAQP